MALKDYSTTPANNNAAPPNGAPEGIAAAAVNDTIRQIMADVKAGVPGVVGTKALMSALDPTKLDEGSSVSLTSRATAGDGGGGLFIVTKTNISAQVTTDPEEGVHVPFDSDVTGASGGFVRNRFGTGVLNVLWFGAKGVATDDTTACQAALNLCSTNGGGEVFAPTGTYLISTTLLVKPRCGMVGEGAESSTFSTSTNISVFTLGENTGSLQKSPVLRNLGILFNLNGAGGGPLSAHGIDIISGDMTVLDNILIQSLNVDALNLTKGVVWDPAAIGLGSIFTFMYGVKNTHVHTGFSIESKVGQGTSIFAFACTSFGDIPFGVTTSEGWHFAPSTGNGSLISGGNLESCGTAVHFDGGSQNVTFTGTRFEANTVDVLMDALTIGAYFFGCLGIEDVVDNSGGSGFGDRMFWACSLANNTQRGNFSTAEQHQQITRNPVVSGTAYDKITALTGNTTSPFVRYENASEAALFEIGPEGGIDAISGTDRIIRASSNSPEGVVTANPGSLFLRINGGAITSFYVKESGAGNVGWAAK